MIVSSFLLLKRSTADALAEHALAALARWSAQWAALPDHGASCRAASDMASALAAAPAWRCRTLAGGGSAWLALPADFARHLEQCLFGLGGMDATADKHVPSAIGAALVEEALEALLTALLDGLSGAASQPAPATPVPAALWRRGSGAVLCSVAFGERTISCLLPAAVLAALPATGPALPSERASALAGLHQALATLPVPLSVEVGQAELTLGYLRTLAVGDVLALPARVDQTLRVSGPGDSTVCHAHLGAHNGFRAVELIKTAQ